jgi:3-oxoacyl-[acyl-carrier-protein] synthase-3
MGTDGLKWDKLIIPFGGLRLPLKPDVINLEVKDSKNNVWSHDQGLMDGYEVFCFSTEIGPKNIREIMDFSGLGLAEIDFFSIHQANKQIVETIIARAGIPAEKTTTETFTKYANNSTNSVVTVLCDQLVGRPVKNVVLCTFGIGLSWGTCLLDLSGMHNGGISTYIPPSNRLSREEQIAHWINCFKGEGK